MLRFIGGLTLSMPSAGGGGGRTSRCRARLPPRFGDVGRCAPSSSAPPSSPSPRSTRSPRSRRSWASSANPTAPLARPLAHAAAGQGPRDRARPRRDPADEAERRRGGRVGEGALGRRRPGGRVRAHPAPRRPRVDRQGVLERARLPVAEIPRRRAHHVGHRAGRERDGRDDDAPRRGDGHGPHADPARPAHPARPDGRWSWRAGSPRSARLPCGRTPPLRARQLIASPQDEAAATLAPMLEKKDGAIDWARPARAIDDHVRGMSPWPGAFTTLHGKTVKVHVTAVLEPRARRHRARRGPRGGQVARAGRLRRRGAIIRARARAARGQEGGARRRLGHGPWPFRGRPPWRVRVGGECPRGGRRARKPPAVSEGPRTRAILAAIASEFPDFAILPESKSRLQRAIHVALAIVTLGGQRVLTERGTTPSCSASSGCPTAGPPWMTTRATCCFATSAFTFGRTSAWGCSRWRSCTSCRSSRSFWYGRARLEWEAYTETLRATAEVAGVAAAEALRPALVARFTGGAYGFMSPFPRAIHRWFDQAIPRPATRFRGWLEPRRAARSQVDSTSLAPHERRRRNPFLRHQYQHRHRVRPGRTCPRPGRRVRATALLPRRRELSGATARSSSAPAANALGA